jgi:hypothetical protein
MEGDKADVSHWLIDASKKTNTMIEDRDWLNGDAVTIIIAEGMSLSNISRRFN